jgi:hypothetical protein
MIALSTLAAVGIGIGGEAQVIAAAGPDARSVAAYLLGLLGGLDRAARLTATTRKPF